jgi:hypothetical protein
MDPHWVRFIVPKGAGVRWDGSRKAGEERYRWAGDVFESCL